MSKLINCSIIAFFVLGAATLEHGLANELGPVEVNVFPSEIKLQTIRDRQSIVVQAKMPDGITIDVTDRAIIDLEDASKADVAGAIFTPKSNGETRALVKFEGHEVTVPVSVEKADVDPPVSYRLDVVPIFMRAGCNTGSCHGAARGKDGFMLSLFGYDPDGDYQRLTRELSGRRIDLALPGECLLIEKSTGTVPHSGGKRIEIGDEYYDTLLRWLQAGAKPDVGEVPVVESIELFPNEGVLNGEGTTQALTVLAHYSSGDTRDVTSLAVFSTNNDNSASVSPDGTVTAAKRGEAFVMARFDTHTVGSHFVVLPKDLEFEWANPEEANYVDTLINDKLQKLRINPSQLCTDEEFLRRASLDICGVLPTESEYEAFVNDADPKKRENLVDRLLDRKEFVELWVMKWSELLRVRSTNRVSYKSMLLYYDWLKERVSSNVPIDQMVREILMAKGGTFANAATNYYQDETDTLKVAENVAQVFMGMRIQCAQCHNHPFDRWTQDDYYGFAAFFSQIGRKRSEDSRETIIYNRGSGDVKHPVDARVMAPKFLGGEAPETKGKDRREVLAGWLASSENPYFATNLANIVWAHFFGKGIVEPVDDVRVSNPPVNEALLDALGTKFTEYNYDFKQIVRDICNSRTYQLSTATNATNATDETNFSHASIRRVRAEVLLDIISQVTDADDKFKGLPQGARAVQIADGNTTNYFLTAFGRATRETVCSCEVKIEPNLSQALHLLNGTTIETKVRNGKVVPNLLAEKMTPEDVIRNIYVRCLTRNPTEQELEQLARNVNARENKNLALEDVFWAVLNSQEFVFNH